MMQPTQILQRGARLVGDLLGRDTAAASWVRPLYEHLLNLATNGRGIVLHVNGEPFRISPFHRSHVTAEYDPGVAGYLRQHVVAGDLCMNVGGNVGIYALQLARWSAPDGRVIVFEPNPHAAR